MNMILKAQFIFIHTYSLKEDLMVDHSFLFWLDMLLRWKNIDKHCCAVGKVSFFDNNVLFMDIKSIMILIQT